MILLLEQEIWKRILAMIENNVPFEETTEAELQEVLSYVNYVNATKGSVTSWCSSVSGKEDQFIWEVYWRWWDVEGSLLVSNSDRS